MAGVAHEINTPVGIAVSSASYLSDRTEAAQALVQAGRFDVAAQQSYLRDARESARLLLSNARRMAQLVLNFKQLAVDRIIEARQPFDLKEHLKEVIRDLQPKLGESRVEVSIDVASSIQMDSYPVALAQVVTNLAINSLQHAYEPGGQGKIVIQAALSDDDEIRIEYCDDGRGIEPALQGQVFEPFFTTRRLIGGSGLGLYIVNQIVTRQLDGSIVLVSNVERGVRFVIHFPRVARHAPNVGHLLTALPRTTIDEP